MGFSGGGANITKAHTHSGAISQDGGDLNFNNVTQAGMSEGDITFSDGTALQVLGLGSATDTLTVNAGATAPEWTAAAGGGPFTLIDHTVIASNTTTIETLFTNIDGDDMSELYCVTTGYSGGNVVQLQLYDQTQTLITGSNYGKNGYLIDQGVQALAYELSDDGFTIVPASVEPHMVIMHISLGGSNAGASYARCEVIGCARKATWHYGGMWTGTPALTGIAGLKLGISASDSIEGGTIFDIYRVGNT